MASDVASILDRLEKLAPEASVGLITMEQFVNASAAALPALVKALRKALVFRTDADHDPAMCGTLRDGTFECNCGLTVAVAELDEALAELEGL